MSSVFLLSLLESDFELVSIITPHLSKLIPAVYCICMLYVNDIMQQHT
jgi:hypothetical protein